jgi:hypothetical protein
LAPAAPGIPPGAAPRVGQVGGEALRAQRAEVAALRARQSELTKQLQSLESTRNRLSEQVSRTGDAAVRSGLLERLAQLDKQILQLDGERGEVGRSIAAYGPALTTTSGQLAPPPPSSSSDEGPIIISSLLIIFVAFPLVLAYARRIWKRTPSGPAIPREWNDVPMRLEHLEHAVDAVAIEVERVSEGQRFVTRLMTENQFGPAVAAVRASADAARDLANQPTEAPAPKALGAGERPFEPIEAAEHEEARLRRR